MQFDFGAAPAGALRVAIVVALGIERASLSHQPLLAARGWLVTQSGPGPERAAYSAAQALSAGARALVSWGLAGGLDGGLPAGTVVMPQRVVQVDGATFPVDARWHARLSALGSEFVTSSGELLSVAVPLDSPAAKAAAAATSGAVAVDMESAAVASVAARAGVPFVALRVVVDTRDDRLPRGAEAWIDGRGNRRVTAGLRAVVSPSEWPNLLRLARRYRVASRVLERLARRVTAERLLDCPVASVEYARS